MHNNLSTLLLIGVLLFLIYCLMKQPVQSSDNARVGKDKFEDVDSPVDSPEHDSTEQDNEGSEVHENFENYEESE